MICPRLLVSSIKQVATATIPRKSLFPASFVGIAFSSIPPAPTINLQCREFTRVISLIQINLNQNSLPSRRSMSSSNDKQKDGKRKHHRGRKSYRFIDQTRVRVSGGIGGNGSLSMYHIGRKRKRRPDGGHGGNGGSVVIVADPNEQSLKWTKPHVMADAGAHGGNQEKHGKNGRNVILRVPCGVVVRRVLEADEHWDEEQQQVRKIHQSSSYYRENGGSEEELLEWRKERNVASHQSKPQIDKTAKRAGGYLASNDYDSDEDDSDDDEADNEMFYHQDSYINGGEVEDNDHPYNHLGCPPNLNFTAWGEREKVQIADLNEPGSHIVVATGGRGGLGSSIFASQHGATPPPDILAKYAKPREGETVTLELELKMIADIGLVGFPNAGKSSLLSAVSRATPYIAPYPFTTLNPLVGYIEYQDGFRVCAADIPGLIAGASEGRGKGHEFLRHLERTKALLYIVDAAAMDGRDPIQDFDVLVNELSAYGNGDLLNRKCLVVANKMDLLLKEEREEIMGLLQEKAINSGVKMLTDVMGISAGATGEGLPDLTGAIRKAVIQSSSS